MAELLKTKRQSSAIQSARVERILEIATDNELKKLKKTYLATIGSTAPFIGLFGTMGNYEFISIYSHFKEHKFGYSPESPSFICYSFRVISSYTSSCCV